MKLPHALEIDHFYQSKYKACRAAFLEISRINRKEEKIRMKNRQRIIQLSYEGIAAGKGDPSVYRRFEKILGILQVSGHAPD